MSSKDFISLIIQSLQQSIASGSKEKIIKDGYLLEQLFINIHSFFSEAKLQIIHDFAQLCTKKHAALAEDIIPSSLPLTHDMRFLKEIDEQQRILTERALLSPRLLNDQNLHEDLLAIYQSIIMYSLDLNNTKINPECGKLISMIPRADCYFIIRLIVNLLNNIYREKKIYKKEVNLRIFYILYLLEDIIMKDVNILSHPLFLELIAKLLIVFDDLHLLYITVPYFSLCDERLIAGATQFYEGSSTPVHSGMSKLILPPSVIFSVESTTHPMAREGGAVRIFLKILFAYCKADRSSEDFSIIFLEFYIFHKITTRKTIKIIAKFTKESMLKESEKKKEEKEVSGKAKSQTVKRKSVKAASHYSLIEICPLSENSGR